jgi:hypothetical protein
VVIEALDVRGAADDHHGVVALPLVEPEIEVLVSACDLDALLEERRRVTLGVPWVRREERDSSVRP